MPDREKGCCLDPGENRTSLEGEGGAGPCPTEREKDKHLKPSKGRDNMEKKEEDKPMRM